MKTSAFPVTVVDDFLEEPDIVRDFALRQQYKEADKFNYPGLRSKELRDINPSLNTEVYSKILSIFYDYGKEVKSYAGNACFQIVDQKYGSGWIHTDDSIATAIIYLNPTNTKSGTTIYKPKNPFDRNILHNEHKSEHYKNGGADFEKYEKYRLENNDRFEPSVTISSEYNRMILFDSHLYHGAQDFFNEKDKNGRLTLIVFLWGLMVKSSLYPKQRMDRSYFLSSNKL